MHTLPQKSLLAVFSAVLFVAESHGTEPNPEIADLKSRQGYITQDMVMLFSVQIRVPHISTVEEISE